MSRCSGGLAPTAPVGQRRRPGAAPPWNWPNFNDIPPAIADGALSFEESNREGNEIMNKYGGSGYAGSEDIVGRRN
eukprot:11248537-Alexandrium_andersonii.AAC.1